MWYAFVMQLFLAMSCLQGRPMHDAFDDLARLEPDGIQLTPGNMPTRGFPDHVASSTLAIRTHHGFTPKAIRQPVWSDDGAVTGAWDSVHPLYQGEEAWLPADPYSICLETMYPGQPLGTGEAVSRAMDMGLRLAVDVSHVFIQLEAGAMTQAQWHRLQTYDQIEEVHVSANSGKRDSHKPITTSTFGLVWARERGAAGTPVVLESYMHKMSDDERRQQLDLVRGTHG